MTTIKMRGVSMTRKNRSPTPPVAGLMVWPATSSHAMCESV